MARTKHVPQRTCVGCRRTDAKRQLVRVIRTPQGGVHVDEPGKGAGRGAYICADASCWEAALKRDRLERALRTTLTPEDRDNLRRYAGRFEPVGAGQ